MGAEVVFAGGGERGDDRGDQVAQALDVGGEDLEDFGLGNALALVEAGVQVGDQGQRGVAEGQLAGTQPCSRAVAMPTMRTDGQYGSANGTWHAPWS